MAYFKKLIKKGKKKEEGAYAQFNRLYSLSNVILGTGSYAEVRKATRRSDGEVVAVKIIDKTGLSDRELEGLSKEVDILKSLRHKNVVRLYDWFSEEETMYVVMEYVGGGELFKKIVSEDRPFTENHARNIIRTLTNALKHCKERGVIHRDIKPQNLLLTSEAKDAELKLADFNLSIQVNPETVDFSLLQTMCGTPNYVAPEILSQRPYDYKCDIWSLGVICYLLLSGGYLPFFVEEEGEDGKEALLRQVRKGKWSFHPSEAWAGVSDTAKDFLKKVMTKDPEKRLDYDGMLAHPWLAMKEDKNSAPINIAGLRKAEHLRQMQCAHTVVAAANRLMEIMNDGTAAVLPAPMQRASIADGDSEFDEF